MTIWKFPIELRQNQVVPMPAGARLLTVQMQGPDITVWALVDAKARTAQRRFYVIGTGHPLPDSFLQATYLGTVQQGPYVWHIFYTEAEL